MSAPAQVLESISAVTPSPSLPLPSHVSASGQATLALKPKVTFPNFGEEFPYCALANAEMEDCAEWRTMGVEVYTGQADTNTEAYRRLYADGRYRA